MSSHHERKIEVERFRLQTYSEMESYPKARDKYYND